MVTVYDKDGNAFQHCHPVDAKEAVATKRFFFTNPKAPVVPEEAPPVKTEAPGEDIEPLNNTPTEPVKTEVEEVENFEPRKKKKG